MDAGAGLLAAQQEQELAALFALQDQLVAGLLGERLKVAHRRGVGRDNRPDETRRRKFASLDIDERVLWIRTGTAFGRSQATRAVAGSKWLVDRANWMKVADALRINFRREPLPYAFALVAVLLWGGLRWTLRSRLKLLGIRAANDSCRIRRIDGV